MKIGFINEIPYKITGVSVYAHNLVKELKDINKLNTYIPIGTNTCSINKFVLPFSEHNLGFHS